MESDLTIAVLASFMITPKVSVDNHLHDLLSKAKPLY